MDMDITQVPAGYKQTDLGVLPEEWEVKSLGELGSCIIGLTYSPRNIHEGGVTVLRSSNIQDSQLDLSDQVRVRASIPERLFVQQDDLLICVRNGSRRLIGKCLLLDSKTKGMTFGAFMSVYRSSLNKYIHHVFKSYIVAKQIDENLGATINSITNKDLNSYQIPLPPLPEQQAIAKALGSLDALLAVQRARLHKKRLLKQGMLQQLLSGEKRLPGFSGEWKKKTFGDVMTGFSSGATPLRSNKKYYTGNIKWITSGELNYNVILDTVEHISKEAVVRTNLRILPKGTFLMAITGLEAAGTRGSCAITGVEATTNQSCMALFPGKELTTEYLFHYYVLHGDALALEYCQGTKQQSYTGKIVKRLPILLPPTIEEQQAITAVLGDMDAEIAQLEKQHAKTQALKQGMMQQLLTGKLRLV